MSSTGIPPSLCYRTHPVTDGPPRYYSPVKHLNAVGHPDQEGVLTYGDPDLQTQVPHSPDGSLTAFCQLAALRLGVQRVGISLISQYHQYILAEATPTLDLADSTQAERPEDALWLGLIKVAILCGYFMCPRG